MRELDPVDPRARLSPHLTWGEATATAHRGFLDDQEDPPPVVRANLRRLAVDVFEPARAMLGPLRVTSGYRCPALNRAVGGSRTSAHMDGRALDLVPLEAELRAAFQLIVQSSIPYDQAILEFGRWIHLGAALHGAVPRREALVITEPGRYRAWRPA